MYFSDYMQKLLKTEKNPINRMYLNEIMIKWKRVEKAAEDYKNGGSSLDEYVPLIDSFAHELQNKKYKTTNQGKGGFKGNSDLFSVIYIDDLINLMMLRRKIPTKTGLHWGYQRFSTNFKFYQQTFYTGGENPKIELQDSPKFLQLTQKLDFQYRLMGKRNFNKYHVTMPILVFHTYRNFREEHYIRDEYFAKRAKATYENSKSIIVTETMESGFSPDIEESSIDAIFVLRKQTKSNSQKKLSITTIKALDKHIYDYLFEKVTTTKEAVKNGIIK